MFNRRIDKLQNTILFDSLNLLKRSDKRLLIIITVSQIIVNLLDLLGIGLIGILSALSVQGIESQHPGNRVSLVLRTLHLDHISFRAEVAYLAIGATVIFISKTILSMIFTKKIFNYLSKKGAEISAELISKILSQDLVDLQKRTAQEILYIVSSGVNSIVIGIIGTMITVLSDFTILLIISTSLFIVDPVIALSTVALFASVAFVLHYFLQVRAREIGIESNKLAVQNNEKILEVLNSYRESVVHDRRDYYVNEISVLRFALASLTAESSFLPYISKYIIESASILGILALGGYEFGTKNAVYAFSILAVFMAATSRIGPAALRIQQGLLTIRSSGGAAASTFELIEGLKNDYSRREYPHQANSQPRINPSFEHKDFAPKIFLENVCFSYSESSKFSMKDISLIINEGERVAIVGPSGGGKTTLIDLILGVLEPQSGIVTISGCNPREAFKIWPGAISYVPQNVNVVSGTVRHNVALGYPLDFAHDERIFEALKLAELTSTIDNIPEKLDFNVGENGHKFSGGQRQRLGIARALFTSPKFLVLDEATSALDGITEAAISKAIENLTEHTTVLIVAHRLSTAKKANKVVYIENGRILAIGSFEHVRRTVLDFEKQASLMGI